MPDPSPRAHQLKPRTAQLETSFSSMSLNPSPDVAKSPQLLINPPKPQSLSQATVNSDNVSSIGIVRQDRNENGSNAAIDAVKLSSSVHMHSQCQPQCKFIYKINAIPTMTNKNTFY